MSSYPRASALLLAGALVISACGSSDDEATESLAFTETSMPEAEDATEEADNTIVGVAASNPDFASLSAGIEASQLTAALTGDGPFTVFAPTNAAFAAALDELDVPVEELLSETAQLAFVFSSHIVSGEFTAADLAEMDGKSLPTMSGEVIEVVVDGDTITANGAVVTQTDVAASNGVIHVIDSVLLPETP